jgi:hypothetical protein
MHIIGYVVMMAFGIVLIYIEILFMYFGKT